MSEAENSLAPIRPRSRRLDVLKGIMLYILATGHIKGHFPALKPFLEWTWRPFGFFSMAEGFVVVSGILSGLSLARMGTVRQMLTRMGSRTLRVYLYHVLLTAGVVIAIYFYRGPIALEDPRRWVRSHPWGGFFRIAALLYYIPLFEILPFYMFMLLLSAPAVRAIQIGRGVHLLFVSFAIWAGALVFSPDPSPISMARTFNPFSWQILYFAGLYFGAQVLSREPENGTASTRRIFIFDCFCLCAASYLFLWRQGVLPALLSEPIGNSAVSPRRLLPWGVLVNVFVFCRALRFLSYFRYERWPGAGMLAIIGRESLLVFCWNVFSFYLLAGLNFDYRHFSTGEQFFLYATFLIFAISPIVIKRWYLSRRESPSTNAS